MTFGFPGRRNQMSYPWPNSLDLLYPVRPNLTAWVPPCIPEECFHVADLPTPSKLWSFVSFPYKVFMFAFPLFLFFFPQDPQLPLQFLPKSYKFLTSVSWVSGLSPHPSDWCSLEDGRSKTVSVFLFFLFFSSDRRVRKVGTFSVRLLLAFSDLRFRPQTHTH